MAFSLPEGEHTVIFVSDAKWFDDNFLQKFEENFLQKFDEDFFQSLD